MNLRESYQQVATGEQVTIQRQEATSKEAELAWHQQQLREGRLTYQEREYHRDMLSWLEQQRATEKQNPNAQSQPGIRVRERSGGGPRWLPALLAWFRQA